jgi:predicted RNA-binding Zn ribbon-like protein
MKDIRPPPIFIADARGLDFLNSVATPLESEVEWLASGDDLVKWLMQAGMVPAEIPALLQKDAVPGELDAVAARARALREWFRDFVHRHKGAPLEASVLEELGPLNQILTRDEEFGQIGVRQPCDGPGDGDEDGDDFQADRPVSALAWQPMRRWRSPDALLLPIARAMADLVCDDDFTKVKACEGAACTLVFIDRTRRQARRWCRMAVCGNRAKQQAHRDRIKSG